MAVRGTSDIQRPANPGFDNNNQFDQNGFPQPENEFDNQARPPRKAPNMEALRYAEMRQQLDDLRSELKENPRNVMIKVSGWIPQPTVGLPNSSSRANNFASNIEEARKLLEDGNTEKAFELLIECHHDFDCASYEAGYKYSRDKERQENLKSAIKTFAQVGRSFEDRITAEVDKRSPGNKLRLLEEINIADGKKHTDGLDGLYREIAVMHEPFLVSQIDVSQPDVEAQKERKALEKSTQSFNSAVKLFNDKSYDLAQTAFKSFIEKYPNNAFVDKANKAIADCQYFKASGEVTKLEQEMNQLIAEKRKDNPRATLFELEGDKHFWRAELEPVIKSLEAISATDKERAGSLYLRLAEMQQKGGLESDAIELYSQASKLMNDSAYAEYSIGVCYQESYQGQEAEKVFAQFCENHPDNKYTGEVFLRRAHIAFKADQFEDSLANYSKALDSQLDKELREQALFEAGSLELEHGQSAKGRQHLTALIKEFPQSKHLEVAQRLVSSSSTSESFTRAIELANNAETRQEAIELFKKLSTELKATALGEQSAYRTVHHLAESSKWAEVEQHSAKFSTEYPKSEFVDEVRELGAQALHKQGNIDKSVLAYNSLLKDFPQHERSDLWKTAISRLTATQNSREYNSLVALFEKNSLDDIAKELPKYIERHPNDSRIDTMRYNYGTLLSKAGKQAEAIEQFDSLANSSNLSISVNSQLNSAHLSVASGDPTSAKATIDNFIKSIESQEMTPALQAAVEKMQSLDRSLLLANASSYDKANDEKGLSDVISTLQKTYPNSVETAQALTLEANNLLLKANNSLADDKLSQALELYIRSGQRFASSAKIYNQETLADSNKETAESLNGVQKAIDKQIDALRQRVKISEFRDASSKSEFSEVIKLADELLASNSFPNVSDEIRFERAKALAATDKTDEAIAALNALIEDSSSIYDPRARLELGTILLSQGKTQEAGVRFAEAAATKSDDSFSEQLKSEIGRCQVEALFGLLKCYQEKGADSLIDSTKNKIMNHPALTDEDRQRLK